MVNKKIRDFAIVASPIVSTISFVLTLIYTYIPRWFSLQLFGASVAGIPAMSTISVPYSYIFGAIFVIALYVWLSEK